MAHTRAGPAGPGPWRHPSDWHCRRSPRRARQGAAGRDAAAQGRLLHLHEVTSSRGTYLVSRGRWSFWCPASALLSFSHPQNRRLPSSSPRSWPGGPASRDRERKEAPSDSVCWHIALVGAVLQLGHWPHSWEQCSFGRGAGANPTGSLGSGCPCWLLSWAAFPAPSWMGEGCQAKPGVLVLMGSLI